ncbi:hypothetical protein PHYNN_231 [Pantoea phage Phynn]|nr:hypothetical protein PHYNN_231 [Pantoea phage Phynn]
MISQKYYQYRLEVGGPDAVAQEKAYNKTCVELLNQLREKRKFTHYSKSVEGNITWYFSLARYFDTSCTLHITVRADSEIIKWGLSSSYDELHSMSLSVTSRELLKTPATGISIFSLLMILKGMTK